MSDPERAWDISAAGELRERFESMRNEVFGLVPVDDSDTLLHRASLSLDARRGERIGAKVQFISASTSGWDGPRTPIQDNSFDVLQAYAHTSFAIDGATVTLRAGRQEIALGSSRLVSVREGPNVRRAFDGVRATWSRGATLIDAFAVRTVQPEHGGFDDRSSSAETFSGIYGTFGLHAPLGQLETYYLYLYRRDAAFAQGAAGESRHTVGARLAGQYGSADWNLEGAWQWGSFGAASIRAWTLSADVGYQWSLIAFAPRLGLKADAISGDRDLHDGTLGTFNPLFPKLPYFSDANLVTPANLLDLQPSLRLQLAPDVTLSTSWNVLWKFAREDAFYAPPLAAVPGTAASRSRHIGQQTSISLEWHASDALTIAGTYVHFEPGAAARAPGGVDGHFFGGWVQFRF